MCRRAEAVICLTNMGERNRKTDLRLVELGKTGSGARMGGLGELRSHWVQLLEYHCPHIGTVWFGHYNFARLTGRRVISLIYKFFPCDSSDRSKFGNFRHVSPQSVGFSLQTEVVHRASTSSLIRLESNSLPTLPLSTSAKTSDSVLESNSFQTEVVMCMHVWKFLFCMI